MPTAQRDSREEDRVLDADCAGQRESKRSEFVRDSQSSVICVEMTDMVGVNGARVDCDR